MAAPSRPTVRNRLLTALSSHDFALLEPHLQPVTLPLRQEIYRANKPIEELYFPESGFASVTNPADDGAVEVGMIGSEGLVGASPILLGDDRTPHDCFVQMVGAANRISASALQQAVRQSPPLQTILLRYVQAFVTQTAQTAFANATHTIEVRLARWLLMCHDRADSDDIGITHEFLSIMLGVRRPGVTMATQNLEGNRLIRATRGRILVRDRAGLEALAGEAYGVPEAEYKRLIEGA